MIAHVKAVLRIQLPAVLHVLQDHSSIIALVVQAVLQLDIMQIQRQTDAQVLSKSIKTTLIFLLTF